MENVNCKSDHATVTVAGVIEEMMMLKLTNLLQSLHQDLFYKKIELEISSPGGSVVALDHCIEIMERLRKQDVSFTTRALMSTSSAAAFLVSLGDDRQTTRSTKFLYHKARLEHVDAVTARKATEIVEIAHQLDERYLDLLVQRAKDLEREYAQDLPVTEFDDADWPVIDHLLVNAGNIRSGNVRKGPAKTKTLRELRKYVKECLVEDNKLNQLYQTLFDLDRPISAALAIELRLVDGFVDNDGHRTDNNEDGLEVPEWTSLYPPAGQIGREVLCRHKLILGETGSGKTASGILPVVSSIMRNDNQSVGCALIIDPKREIGSHIEGDIELIDPKDQARRPIINLMLRKQQDIEQALENKQYLKAAREILVRSASLSSYSPAKILGGHISTRNYFWDAEGSRFALTILAFVLQILDNYKDIRREVNREVHERKKNSGDMRDVAAFKTLEDFAEKAGVLDPLGGLEQLREDIKETVKFDHLDESSLPIRSDEDYKESRLFASKDDLHWMFDLDEWFENDEYYQEYLSERPSRRETTLSEEEREIREINEEIDKRASAVMDKDDEDLDEQDKEFKKFAIEREERLKKAAESISVDFEERDLFDENLKGSIEKRLEPILKACAEAAEWLIDRVKNTIAYKENEHFKNAFNALGIDNMTNPDVPGLDVYLDVTDGFPDELRDKRTGRRIDNLDGVRGTVSRDKFKYDRHYYRPADLISTTKDRCSRLRQAIEFIHRARVEANEIRKTPNILVLADFAMDTLFEFNLSSPMPAELIVKMLTHGMQDSEVPDVFRQIKYWASIQKGSHRQMAGVIGHARQCFSEYTHQTPAHTLYFGVEPYYHSIVKNDHDEVIQLDFDSVVSEKKKRSVFLFQPDIKNDEALVARALKAAWFEAVLYCKEREENGASMPMAAYIADEFHRFITIDREHGEQSFLDTCRSFGAFCVLACQSVSSMKHALAEFSHDSYKNDAGISILLNNTACKLLFRTTDKELTTTLGHLSPSLPGIGSVTSIRPLSTLKPGECYASMADGRFERCQLKPYTGKKS